MLVMLSLYLLVVNMIGTVLSVAISATSAVATIFGGHCHDRDHVTVIKDDADLSTLSHRIRVQEFDRYVVHGQDRLRILVIGHKKPQTRRKYKRDEFEPPVMEESQYLHLYSFLFPFWREV